MVLSHGISSLIVAHKPVFHALWRSFTQCVFVEDEGGILFFKNWYGEAILEANSTEANQAKNTILNF
jgi:hypothetical protein